MEELDFIVSETKESMAKAIEHLENEMSTVRAGRANVSLLNNIYVEAYGSQMPLNQTANVSTPDARTIMIKPWDKTMLEEIEKALLKSNIGLTPQNDGEQIRLNIPPLTEERRIELVKQIKAMGEKAKISIRSARKDGIHEIQKTGKEENISEDTIKGYEEDIQKLTDEYSTKVDNHINRKEEEILKV